MNGSSRGPAAEGPGPRFVPHHHVGSDADRPPRLRRPRQLTRSLALTLVVLVAVPSLVAVFQIVAGLDRRRSTAVENRQAAARFALLGDLATFSGSITVERVESLAICAAMAGGIDPSELATIVGYDVMPYLQQARAAVDESLAAFVTSHGDVPIEGGTTAGSFLDDAAATLADQRAQLDGECASVSPVERTLMSLLDVADTVRSGVVDSDGAPGAGASSHLLRGRMGLLSDAVAAIVGQTTATLAALVDPDATAAAREVMRASGVADYMVSRYDGAVQQAPERIAPWAALQAGSPTTVFDSALEEFLHALASDQLPRSGDAPGGRDAIIRTRGHVLLVAVQRLDAYVDYARSEFELGRAVAAEAAADADADWIRRAAVLVVGAVLLAVFLIGTITKIVVPLRRLVVQGRRFVHGESGPALVPAGPSDIREVTETFNWLTATVASFEHELSRAARGEEPDPMVLDAMPGTLGASLRTSVSRLANLTRQLTHSEALSSAIVETAADAIWTLDDRDHVVSANQAAVRLLGVPHARQIGSHLPSLLGGRASCADLDGEIDLARANGTVSHLFVSRSTVPAEPHPVTSVFARDVSDQRRFEQRLAFQARYDVLTGLPNRLAAFEHLDAVLGHSAPAAGQLAVLFIDLDGFKAVNDSRGHSSGDRLLQVVARRLRTGLRNSEFVARLGGDEFLVVMEGAGVESATALARRTLESIARPFASEEDRFVISASIGIALGTPGQVDSIELVRQADIAVYHAKEAGRARTAVFDVTLQAAIEANAEVELALRSAIANQELELYYQPVLDLRNDRPWGAEALLRWNRPGHGLDFPDRFIPVAERSNLILDFGRWVLLEACRKLALWQQQQSHRHLRLAVNISGRHLAEGDLVADVDAALAATGADPTGLEIELTETHLLDDLDRTNVILDDLRSKGLAIAVDDFGTGYSSMTYLRQLHIDTLKMDRTFIGRVEQSGYDRTIVDVIIQLGQTLHLAVVAEGIETVEQLDILRHEGCDRAQGYLFARPMPSADFDQWLVDVWANVAPAETPAAAPVVVTTIPSSL